MGRGSSGAGSSAKSGGGSSTNNLDRDIHNAMNGGLNATAEEVQQLSEVNYLIDASKLSPAEQQTLATATMQSILDNGQMAKNPVSTADGIFGGKTVPLNLSQFTSSELAQIIPLLHKAGNDSAVHGGLMMLSYYNQ